MLVETLIESNQSLKPFLSEHRPGDFSKDFENAVFAFKHQLPGHPLFEIDRLVELAQSLSQQIYFDMGDAKVNDRWDSMPPRNCSAAQAIQGIETAQAWMAIRDAQRDPQYADVLRQYLSEAEALVGRSFRRVMRNDEMIIFVTSPRRITTYHIDRECNFLLQVTGDKVVHTFDGRDRSIVTEEELERFWTVDNNAAPYREASESRATNFHLKPGDGIHIPVNFPHWVQNGDHVSVAVSINFQFVDEYRANLYRANYHLRRLGITPTPPGRSKLRDGLKSQCYNGAMKVQNILSGSRRTM